MSWPEWLVRLFLGRLLPPPAPRRWHDIDALQEDAA